LKLSAVVLLVFAWTTVSPPAAWASATLGDVGGSGPVIQVFGGAVLNLPTALTVRQQGESDLEHSARWETRSLRQPFYWALRLRWQNEVRAWELQLLHHKLHLANPPVEISDFEVTHGFNILTVAHVWRGGSTHLRGGAGVVIPHAESTVRGQHHASAGYTLGGPAVMFGVGSEKRLTGGLFLAMEAQFIAAWATVPVASGEAKVTAMGVHFLLGLGYLF